MKDSAVFLILPLLFLISCGSETAIPVQEASAGEVDNTEAGSVAPKTKADFIQDTSANIRVDAGFASNGTTITIPTGFTVSQCKFTAAAANIDGKAISTRVSINNTTGEVLCQKVVQEREEVPPEAKDCTASYTVICVK